ncbi:2-dehydro-3-deoxygluconokinase [Virgibacillus soli]|nr:2-dehydro-3-deoxygluconokinase [Virgibacillus soli]
MNKRIAAFGEVMMRLQVPNSELLTQANTLQYSFSGTGVNIAAALAKMGHKGYLISTLPENALGEAAYSYIRKLGIETDFVYRRGSYIGMYFLESGFGSRSSRVTYTNRQESSFNTAPRSFYSFKDIANSIDFVHFCGITLSVNDKARVQMKELARNVKAAGGKVVFDCNYRPSLWGNNGYQIAKPHYEEMLELADIAMMNEKDAMLILGMHTNQWDRQAQLEELIPKVAERYDISIIAGTHRNIHDNHQHTLKGFLYKDSQFTYSKALQFSVLDRIGAGDAFTSGIIHGFIQNESYQWTVDFAVTAAKLAHTIVGDTPLSTEREIMQAMNHKVADVVR